MIGRKLLNNLHLPKSTGKLIKIQSKDAFDLLQSISRLSCFVRKAHANSESLCNGLSSSVETYFDFDKSKKKVVEPILQSIELYLNFINENEESELLNQIDKLVSRRRYEDSHWDYAILQFREVECRSWNPENQKVIDRIRLKAFRDDHPSLSFVPSIQDSNEKVIDLQSNQNKTIRPLESVHVLDLAADGCIKPHVDAVRFCGPIIAGLSLGSDCVMRFARSGKTEEYVDVLLPCRSLYVMSGYSRYECTHEIFGPDESKFKNKPIRKSRRVSLMARCHPITLKTP